LLVVEDDAALRDVLVRALTEAGHVVDSAADGAAGEVLGGDDALDAIVMDVMLPARDGVSVVRSLRGAGISTPILLLTARTAEADTVAGLDAGADDYLRKPFSIAELQARIRSLARRERTYRPTVLRSGAIVIDPASRRARRGERDLELTLRESAFLEYFMRNAGRALSRDMIAAALWPSEADIASNIIDVYVRRLRTKLHGPGESRVLATVRGVGYRLELE
jgi:two-component system OmpR family response regulator